MLVKIRASSLDEIKDVVTRQIRAIEGIWKTVTSAVLHVEKEDSWYVEGLVPHA